MGITINVYSGKVQLYWMLGMQHMIISQCLATAPFASFFNDK